jgi:hypothetical protein
MGRRPRGHWKSAVNLTWGNRALNGDVLASRLMRDGVQIGAANWFAKDQVLLWDIPGVTSGSLTAAELTSFGGWPFAPDAEWLNLQTIAFYHFKTAIDKQGSVARRQPGPSAPNRVLDFFVAPVLADAGCDGLHWLDGTVLRFCCDVHDLATKNTDATIGLVAVVVELDAGLQLRRGAVLHRRRAYPSYRYI